MELLLALLLGLVPVILFLASLRAMDSHQLTPVRRVAIVIFAGMGAALISLFCNSLLRDFGLTSSATFTGFVAPAVEELVKGAVVVALFRAHRVGFLVDAAILGFAVGAGFALTENLYLLLAGPPMSEGVWLIRGLGTAVMHGGVSAIFALMAQRFTERSLRLNLVFFLPGLVVATVLHWAFNQFYLSPLLHTIVVLTVLPVLLVFVFRKSAGDLHAWLQLDFDSDADLIRQIDSGELRDTNAGRFLADIRARFPGHVVGDMLCYLRVYTELALRAKGLLMMRQHGLAAEPDPEVRDMFNELRYLRRSIGRIGVLALRPFLHFDRKDRWQLTVLEERYRTPADPSDEPR